MKTYPHQEGGEIIVLVRKDELDNALELLREIRDGEVNPQDEADKFLRDHQPSELSKWRALAEMLATAAKSYMHECPADCDETASFYAKGLDLTKALTAYAAAKSGNLPDPLAEAVKRMEAVPLIELSSAWDKTDVRGVRARLIQAAKGVQP